MTRSSASSADRSPAPGATPLPDGDADREQLLGVYLRDHLAGAAAGRARLARAARAHRGSALGAELDRLHRDVAADRRELVRLAGRLGVRGALPHRLAARAGEALGALKPNGRLVRRSPLRTVVELEALHLGVLGKAAGWRTLRVLAERDDRLDATALDRLVARAREQAEALDVARLDAVRHVLAR